MFISYLLAKLVSLAIFCEMQFYSQTISESINDNVYIVDINVLLHYMNETFHSSYFFFLYSSVNIKLHKMCEEWIGIERYTEQINK